MSDKTLSLAAMERLLREAGAERVSEDAKEELKKVLEEISLDLGKKAAKYSLHAGRKTVRAEDIRLACD